MFVLHGCSSFMDHATLREAALELEHLPTLAVTVFEVP